MVNQQIQGYNINKPVQNFLQLKQYCNKASFSIIFQVTEF